MILGLAILGLFSFANELDRNAMQEHTVTNSTKDSDIDYIVNTDGTKDVKINLYSNSFDSLPLSEIKYLIYTFKDKKDIRKVLIDFDVSSVKDYMQSSISKEQVDWKRNRVKKLLSILKKEENIILTRGGVELLIKQIIEDSYENKSQNIP